MKKTVRPWALVGLALFVATAFSCASGAQASGGNTAGKQAPAGSLSAEPGTFENAAPAGLPAVIALNSKLNPAADELVIYYVRPDKSYDKWALWLWAVPGGDGGAAWPNTQEWTVQDGIGYMRFKLDGSDLGVRPVGSDGQLGLIVREKAGWNKDGNDDRVWDTNVSNVIAVFSGDQATYAAKEYKPKAMTASLESETKIQLLLSGRYGLDTDGGPSGFSVVSKSGKTYSIAKAYNAESPDDLSKNYARRVTIELSEPVDPSDALVLRNPVFEGDKDIDSSKLAVKLADRAVPGKNAVLGALYDPAAKSVEFRLWAPTSSSATANLYAGGSDKTPAATVALSLDKATGVWSGAFSERDGDGMFYDFTLTNAKGTVTVLDPYARSMAAYKNEGGNGRAAIVNLASPRANPAGGMTASYVKLAQREDAVIYEMSVRDFTVSPDSGVKAAPGSYLAFIEKIPYLKSLGITHVQLMPVLNFYFTDETKTAYEGSGTVSGNNYNWGYDPHNYFTPEGWYSSNAADPYARVAELRTLINELHKAGLGVLLDVVYNHMGSVSFLDDVVPGYFFRTNAQGKLTSASGCGNDVATERVMARKLIVDSLAYWTREYKVDGFRFDLMGLMDTETVLSGYAAAKAINPDTLFEGEGWKMYNGPAGTSGMDQKYMTKTDSIAVFNDEIRDLVKAGGFNETAKGFITAKAPDTERFYRNVLGQPQMNYKADDPGDNLQYLTAHDGLTLRDAISNNVGLKASDPAQKAELVRRVKLGNFIVQTSQGIAFMHGGMERGRTKPNVTGAKNETVGDFVRNSYDSADNINQIEWKLDSDWNSVLEYTKGMIALRRAYDVFRVGDMAKINAAATLLPCPEENRLVLAYSLDWTDGRWFVAMNADVKPMTVELGVDAGGATVFADANGASVKGIASPAGVKIAGSAVTLDALTATVFRIAK